MKNTKFSLLISFAFICFFSQNVNASQISQTRLRGKISARYYNPSLGTFRDTQWIYIENFKSIDYLIKTFARILNIEEKKIVVSMRRERLSRYNNNCFIVVKDTLIDNPELTLQVFDSSITSATEIREKIVSEPFISPTNSSVNVNTRPLREI